jgi:polyribonucleotide nucleotidyltransferase
VPNRTAGAIIGKGGANIREISTTSGARVDVQRRDQHEAHAQERLVTVKGSPSQAAAALGLILSKARSESEEDATENGDAATAADELPMPVKLCVPNELVGHVIGKQGSHIKQVKEDTGADIKVDPVDMTSAYFPTRCVLRVCHGRWTDVGAILSGCRCPGGLWRCFDSFFFEARSVGGLCSRPHAP